MVLAAVVGALWLGLCGSAAAVPVITEFSDGMVPGSYPRGITAGPDGNLWFNQMNPARIGRITPRGEISTFTTEVEDDDVVDSPVAGPDDSIWFTVWATEGGLGLGQMTLGGDDSLFDTSPYSDPSYGMAYGPDGNLWFTHDTVGEDRVIRVTDPGPFLSLDVFPLPLPNADINPRGITAGPDGNLWVAGMDSDSVFRVTTAGVITEYSAGITPASGPFGITAGPDGNVWFTETDGNRIGKIDPNTGTVTEYSLPTVGSRPYGITAGPDGNLWFTETDAGQIGRITPAGDITEFGVADGISPGGGPQGITTGPGPSVWFADADNAKIIRISGFVPPPDTVIESGPSGTITAGEATFTFRGDPVGETDRVQCRLDGEPFTDCVSPKTFTGLADGTHTVEFRAENLLGETAATTASRTFTVKVPTPPTPPAPPAPPQPVVGKRVVVKTGKGRVRVRLPGAKKAVPLEQIRAIPVGSVVDTTAGTVVLTVAAAKKKTQTARFRYGEFKVTQPKKANGYTVLKMRGRLKCGGGGSKAGRAAISRARRKKAGRKLWGKGKGRFTTSGSRGSGSARGTTWQVTDRCDGTTLIKSINGRVKAVDFTTGRSVTLRTGRTLVAGKSKRRR